MCQSSPAVDYADPRINILVLDNDHAHARKIVDLLSMCRLFSIARTDSVAEAAHLLGQQNVHVCICELLADKGMSTYSLLERYSSHTGFIVVTSSSSSCTGYLCCRKGAQALFEKPLEKYRKSFVNALAGISLRSIFGLFNSPNTMPMLLTALEYLFERQPTRVSDWANGIRVSDVYLRKMLERARQESPRRILGLVQRCRKEFAACWGAPPGGSMPGLLEAFIISAENHRSFPLPHRKVA